MRQRHKLAVTFLSVTAVAVACKPAAEPSAVENREAVSPQFDKVKNETKELKNGFGQARQWASEKISP